jgi:hypothetical protein
MDPSTLEQQASFVGVLRLALEHLCPPDKQTWKAPQQKALDIAY